MAKGYKTGGRQPGTPNKEKNPATVQALAAHSADYFIPRLQKDANGVECMISDCQKDLQLVEPADRVRLNINLLEFTSPKRKACDVSLDVANDDNSFLVRLADILQKTSKA